MFEVVNNFVDKETGEKHLIGEEFKPSSQKRGKELVKLGFLKATEKGKSEKGDSNESKQIK